VVPCVKTVERGSLSYALSLPCSMYWQSPFGPALRERALIKAAALSRFLPFLPVPAPKLQLWPSMPGGPATPAPPWVRVTLHVDHSIRSMPITEYGLMPITDSGAMPITFLAWSGMGDRHGGCKSVHELM